MSLGWLLWVFFLTIFVSPHCSVVHCSLLRSNLRGNCANEEGEHVHQTLPLLSRDVQSPASPTHLPACSLPSLPAVPSASGMQILSPQLCTESPRATPVPASIPCSPLGLLR